MRAINEHKQKVLRRLSEAARRLTERISHFRVRLFARIRRGIAYLGEILSWLIIQPIYFLLTLGILVAALAIFAFYPSEATADYVGGALQAAGVLTVAWGVQKTRAQFDHPGFSAHVAKWLSRFPKPGGRVFRAKGIVSATATVKGSAQVSWNINDANSSLEDRLAAVVKNLEQTRVDLIQLEKSVDERFSGQTKDLKNERDERINEAEDIRGALKLAHTGGLHISMMGVVWLFFGIALLTLSEELSIWFAFLN